MIIVAAELLHIFIHFFIGHEYEEHQNNDLASFRNLMLIELVLTIGLAGILFLEGEVSSKLAVIKGNRLYSSALKKLSDQSSTWFSSQFVVKLADKFNHVGMWGCRTTRRCSWCGTTSWAFTRTW